jgi:putative sigma-54 modulation protein
VDIRIAARHGHLGTKAQAAIEEKVGRLSKFFERLTEITVTVNLEHPEKPTVELVVQAEHKHDFVASEAAPELMAAVDAAVHKVEQQLKKYKQKVQDHHRQDNPRGIGAKDQPDAGE